MVWELKAGIININLNAFAGAVATTMTDLIYFNMDGLRFKVNFCFFFDVVLMSLEFEEYLFLVDYMFQRYTSHVHSPFLLKCISLPFYILLG